MDSDPSGHMDSEKKFTLLYIWKFAKHELQSVYIDGHRYLKSNNYFVISFKNPKKIMNISLHVTCPPKKVLITSLLVTVP